MCLYRGESNENLKSAQHNAILCASVGTSHQHGLDARTVYGRCGTRLKNGKALLNLSCTMLACNKIVWCLNFFLSIWIVMSILIQEILGMGQNLPFQNACLSTAMQWQHSCLVGCGWLLVLTYASGALVFPYDFKKVCHVSHKYLNTR